MSLFQTRLFFRIISKSREVYFLKIITLAIAFACSILILSFSINEFGYDRFHQGYNSMFRVLQRNNGESHNGNRLSNKIPFDVFRALRGFTTDSLITARVKMMNKVNILAGNQFFNDSKFYAADPDVSNIFSFEILQGSLKEFHEKERTVILSSTTANNYFGTSQPIGKKLKIYTLRDTILFSVAAVYRDFPQNSHEEFNSFMRFDSSSIQALNFNPGETGIYGKLFCGNKSCYEGAINKLHRPWELTYWLQPISEIYFGPRVIGEESKHGDHYSIVILISITALILFLTLASFINLTTLSLPYRSKELAIRKLAGTSQANLIIAFAKESLLVAGASLALGMLLLAFTSNWIKPILAIDVVSLLLQGRFLLILILTGLFMVIAIAPLIMTFRFTRATPTRLLSTETITFPRFKGTIMFLQLGVSIFLIVASMVMRRQINYSLLKEPGRNYDQIVYVNYPKDLTNEGLINLRATWKTINANIIDVIGTSQLPDQVRSKELHSGFYFMAVDHGFKDFFDLEMLHGNWFRVNDGDSIIVVNQQGNNLLRGNAVNVIGVFKDMSGQFNQPEKPIKVNVARYFTYNFLCIRILEVDIRSTVRYLETYFEQRSQKVKISFLNKRFEEWLRYQDKLNTLSEVLAIITGLLSCCAIYGLSISIVRDKLKQIAIYKLCGASNLTITRLLIKEFASQMLMAILIFGPLTYIILKEMLRNFVYATPFNWVDPLLPFAYCVVIITLLCGFQTLSLNREDLSSALKG
jgi:putative ABC transport system permease protein